MIKYYFPGKKSASSACYTRNLKKYFSPLFILAVYLVAPLLPIAQGITINPRSSLVMNGDITMVINNAPLKNNGVFTASTSTVKFSGNTDTTASYVAGTKTTTFHNLSVVKSSYGVAL